jgi:hypothetical protein
LISFFRTRLSLVREGFSLVEIMMEQLDAPRALKVQAEMSGKTNAYIAQGKVTALQ